MAVISNDMNTLADESDKDKQRRRMRDDPPRQATAAKDGQWWRAVPFRPEAAVARCLATTSSAYNDTPAQPQTHAMGAARRDPRGGEMPVKRRPPLFLFVALAREVVSNRAISIFDLMSEAMGAAQNVRT